MMMTFKSFIKFHLDTVYKSDAKDHMQFIYIHWQVHEINVFI